MKQSETDTMKVYLFCKVHCEPWLSLCWYLFTIPVFATPS